MDWHWTLSLQKRIKTKASTFFQEIYTHENHICAEVDAYSLNQHMDFENLLAHVIRQFIMHLAALAASLSGPGIPIVYQHLLNRHLSTCGYLISHYYTYDIWWYTHTCVAYFTVPAGKMCLMDETCVSVAVTMLGRKPARCICGVADGSELLGGESRGEQPTGKLWWLLLSLVCWGRRLKSTPGRPLRFFLRLLSASLFLIPSSWQPWLPVSFWPRKTPNSLARG